MVKCFSWLTGWLIMSNVILCHQIYTALPKYATGIKDLPHPLNACVFVDIYCFLFLIYWLQIKPNPPNKPTGVILMGVKGIKARWSKPCVWGGGLWLNMEWRTFVMSCFSILVRRFVLLIMGFEGVLVAKAPSDF